MRYFMYSDRLCSHSAEGPMTCICAVRRDPLVPFCLSDMHRYLSPQKPPESMTLGVACTDTAGRNSTVLYLNPEGCFRGWFSSLSPPLPSKYGIQLFVCSYGLALFLETPKHIRKGRTPYIIISWIIFTLFCLAQTGDAYQMFEILYHSAPDDPLDVLRLRHNDDHAWWRLSSTFCIYVVNWIADGLLVYRCYIIWTDKRWVCILPFLTYLSSIAMAIVTFVSIRSSTSIFARINTKALSSWIYLSVGVNFLVTALITFRLLCLRRQMAQFMPVSELRVYLGVVAILVESAVPLTLTGLVFATVSNPKTVQERIPNGMFLVLWFSLNAICPQTIIFRVTTGRSWLRHPEARTNTSNRTETAMTNIAFTRERETGISDGGSCPFDKMESPQDEKVLDTENPIIDVRRGDPAGVSASGA